MLAISPNTKAYLCLADVDFRKGIDGLQAVCRNLIEKDPFSGMIFIFRNRSGSSIRTLAYDGQGFWCAQHGRILVDERSTLTPIGGNM